MLKCKIESSGFNFERRRKGASAVFGVCPIFKLESKGFKFGRRCDGMTELSRLRKNYKIESTGFNFERRCKGASVVFGISLWLLPETETSGLCTDDVAGMAGLEPTISESKSGVLPLHYIPPRL